MQSAIIPVFADTGQNITESGQNGKSDVTVSAEASNFDITVPLGLPLYLHPDGSVTTATDAKIENNSQGPVIVKNVKLTPVDSWKLASFTDNYKTKKVNSKELGFQIMNENVLVDGSVNMKAEDWPPIPGNGDLPLNYDGKVPVRSSDSITTAANLELTFDWDKDGVTVYPNAMYLGRGFTRNIEVLSKPENNVSNTALAVNPLLLTAIQSETSDDDVTFSSSNPNVATIDQDGNVTGVGQGTATITVSSNGKEDHTSITVLNISVSSSEGGVVSLDYEDDIVKFAATANKGYYFANWTDDSGSVVSTDALYSKKLTDNMVLKANFEKDPYADQLTLKTEGSGTVTGGGLYAYGDHITIKAEPSPGYKFNKWSDDNTDATRTIVMDGNISLTAYFTMENYTAGIINSDNGSIHIEPDQDVYHYNDVITLTNTPATGYHFVNYTDSNGNVINSPYTVTGSVTIKANFEPNVYTVTADADSNGSVSGGKDYKYGEQAILTATPNEHYHFVNWTDNDSNVISDQSVYSFTVSNNISYTAHFSIDRFTVTLSSNSGGTVSGSGTYNYGDQATIKATPSSYKFSFMGWSDNVSESTRTITVTDDITLSAQFKQTIFTISGKTNNAENGQALSSVSLAFKQNGSTVKSVTTDSSGNYSVDLNEGNYTVSCSKSGYISTSLSLNVSSDSTENFTLSPQIDNSQFRIVLTWGSTPSDLDSHLIGSTKEVYYSNKTTSDVALDVDDTSSYGPETITINPVSGRRYTYGVKCYSSSGSLEGAQAKVQVYHNNTLVKTYNLNPSSAYKWWKGFSILNGQITTINSYSTSTVSLLENL